MAKKTLMILGHPNNESFCASLADAYCKGAENSRVEIRRINLADLNFDTNLHKGYKEIQTLEPDLEKAQQDILWAEHIVFVYPIWWATMPALLKGFLDRVFLPGFAFKYKKDSPWWDKLLKGKSARLITTMDAPLLYFWMVYFNAGHKAMKKATLEFCGIKPVNITSFSQVKFSTEEKRQKWLEKVEALGEGNL
jgi:NAD(P)H dehydrogenase (quinone)